MTAIVALVVDVLTLVAVVVVVVVVVIVLGHWWWMLTAVFQLLIEVELICLMVEVKLVFGWLG